MDDDFIKTCQYNSIPPLYLAVDDKTVQFFAYTDFIIRSHGIYETEPFNTRSRRQGTKASHLA